MDRFISRIYIDNFKSIRSCEIRDCKRINLFIGKPNVGKSNILEALSVFSLPYLKENTSKKFTNLVRLENEAELFYQGNWEGKAKIETNILSCDIVYSPKEGLFAHIQSGGDTYQAKVDEKLNVKSLSTKSFPETRIKKYTYKHDIVNKKGHSKYLISPYGSNLMSIIENYHELKSDVIDYFKEYGLEIIFDKASQTIKILQSKGKDMFLIPYNSIADTLQRIIFYKAAIVSNQDSVLLFEEPEAHSFPPFMTHLTQEMIYHKDNQYFIATHSPFILNDLLENAHDELAVYIVNYKEGSTQVRPLNKEELHEAYQKGIDLFTNNEMYI